MKRACFPGLVGAVVLLSPSLSGAQGFTPTHDPTIECFPVGKYTLAKVDFPTDARIARARVYFRPEQANAAPPADATTNWYYFELSPTPTGGLHYEGGFPKPKKERVGWFIRYYVSGESVEAATGQTQEYRGEVVRNIEECKKKPLLAKGASPGNFPPGFAAAATFPFVPVVLAAGAAGGAAAIIASDDGGGGTTPPSVTNPPPTNPPPTNPPPTNPPPGLQAACDSAPNTGKAPLAVNFTSAPIGGTPPFGFRWVFGDGQADTPSNFVQNSSHTYATNGQFDAVVRITDANGLTADCRRVVTVGDPCTNLSVNITKPTDGSSIPFSNTITINAESPAATQVTFRLTMNDCRAYSGPTLTEVDKVSPFSAAFSIPGDNFRCFNASATAVCGTQTATDSISFDTFGGGGESRAQALRSTRRRSASKATAGRSANKATAGRRARAGLRERQVVWTSDLQIEGGRGQVVVNGASATQPGVGRAYAVSPAVKGDNRVEATLVTAAGKPGSWRFEFGANSLETGSLRVVAGEVQLVTDNAVVFRLKGTPGERLVFTFRRK